MLRVWHLSKNNRRLSLAFLYSSRINEAKQNVWTNLLAPRREGPWPDYYSQCQRGGLSFYTCHRRLMEPDKRHQVREMQLACWFDMAEGTHVFKMLGDSYPASHLCSVLCCVCGCVFLCVYMCKVLTFCYWCESTLRPCTIMDNSLQGRSGRDAWQHSMAALGSIINNYPSETWMGKSIFWER